MSEIRFGLYVSLALLAIPFHPLHAGAGANPGGALPVVGDAHNRLIPVAVKGYDGEVARGLKFDLVNGFIYADIKIIRLTIR